MARRRVARGSRASVASSSTTNTGHALSYPTAGGLHKIPALYRKYEQSDAHYIVARLPPGFHNSAMELAWTDGSFNRRINRSKIVVRLPARERPTTTTPTPAR